MIYAAHVNIDTVSSLFLSIIFLLAVRSKRDETDASRASSERREREREIHNNNNNNNTPTRERDSHTLSLSDTTHTHYDYGAKCLSWMNCTKDSDLRCTTS